MSFKYEIERAKVRLKLFGREVDAGHWQGVPTGGKPDLVTVEILNHQLEVELPAGYTHEGKREYLDALVAEIHPNLPWADDHFEERVSRVPSNPGEEYKNWPWWHGQDLKSKDLDTLDPSSRPEALKFTHTYQERFWPKEANGGGVADTGQWIEHQGIRYPLGDLDDVVNLLAKEPYTRQAYFPIFFPEDTGAVHGGRIPCSLGYHFMLRDERLHCWYDIRSVDFVRHFRDDIYLACRLMLWVLDELREKELRSDSEQIWFLVDPGALMMNCHSLHYHKGDAHLV